MTIAVDVDLLRQHRLGLLAEADEIERSSSLDPPDVGPLTSVTAEALVRLSERAQRRAGDARELADARHGCERTGRRSRRLAEGLTAYAQGMAEVRRQLDEAVTVAAPHLRVADDRIWSPTLPPDPDDTRLAQAWAAWRDAVDRWRAARDLEERTSQAWLVALDRGVTIDGALP